MHRARFGVSFLVAAFAGACLADDATWINDLIQDTISNTPPGETAVIDLPARPLVIASPVSIPMGSRHVEVRGVPLLTKFVLSGPVTGMITVNGIGNNVGGVWEKDKYIQYSDLYPARKGDTAIRMTPAQPWAMANAYYTIGDQARDRLDQVYLNAQIVKVVSFDESTGWCTLDRPLERDFLLFPILGHVDGRVGGDITLKDIALDGSFGFVDQERGVWTTLTDGVKLINVDTTRFATDNIRFDVCSNVEVIQASATDYRGNDQGGMGRGIALFHCVDVRIQDCTFDKVRHGTMVSSSSKVTIDGCVGNSIMGHDFDTHGLLSDRITVKNCTGNSSLQWGNGSYWQGDKVCEMSNTFLEHFFIVGGVEDAKITNSRAQRLNLQSWGQPSEDFRPKNIVLDGCIFSVGDGTMPVSISGGPWKSIKSITFRNCTFWQLSALGGKRCILMEDLAGDVEMSFVGCTFITTSWTRCLELLGPAQITLSMIDCSWITTYPVAVLLGDGMSGRAIFGGNMLPLGTELLDAPSTVTRVSLD